MNALSCFDGISCGQLALDRAGIHVDNYFASEINKDAIKVTMRNYPNTIQLGSVKDWRTWNLPHIDLLIGGSPCQGFSRSGKGFNFDDPRSELFFEFVNIRNALKPENWMLENVDMRQAWKDIISDYMGIQPVKINSALVSAQNRVRLYWANWNITKPADRRIYLKDILENTFDEKYILSGKRLENFVTTFEYRSKKGWSKLNPKKAITMTARQYANWYGNYVSIFQLPHGNNKGGERALNGKTPSLTNSSWEHNNFLKHGEVVRQLTPVEGERLQTLPDYFTAGISDNKRYEALGNGWTADVVAHIFSQMKSGGEVWHRSRQLSFDATPAAGAGAIVLKNIDKIKSRE